MDIGSTVNSKVITLCTHYCLGMETLPLSDVFVPYQYKIEVDQRKVEYPLIHVNLRKNREKKEIGYAIQSARATPPFASAIFFLSPG